MSHIRDFILALISAAVVTTVLDGIVPDGGLKKYLKYVFALFLLVVLISPLKGILFGLTNIGAGNAANFESTDVFLRASNIVAFHVRDAVCEKFSIDEKDISVKCDGEKIILTTKRRIGLLADDIIYYSANKFGVAAEVIFYE